jgi:hypothetical protein
MPLSYNRLINQGVAAASNHPDRPTEHGATLKDFSRRLLRQRQVEKNQMKSDDAANTQGVTRATHAIPEPVTEDSNANLQAREEQVTPEQENVNMEQTTATRSASNATDAPATAKRPASTAHDAPAPKRRSIAFLGSTDPEPALVLPKAKAETDALVAGDENQGAEDIENVEDEQMEEVATPFFGQVMVPTDTPSGQSFYSNALTGPVAPLPSREGEDSGYPPSNP